MLRLAWLGFAAAVMASTPLAYGQHEPMLPPAAPAQPVRARLYLKDGSYQLVLSYKIAGKLVRYRSAERNGEEEDVPLTLVDLARTQQWAQDHDPSRPHDAAGAPQAAVLSPALAREEAARAARTPLVAPNLKLPEEDSVLVLDTFEGSPELIPLPQQGSDLNRETAHAVLNGDINPASSAHRLLDLKGQRADVQLHVEEPVFFVRIGKDNREADTGGTFVVETHGTGERDVPGGGASSSLYVIERIEPMRDSRIVDSLRLGLLGSGRPQPEIVELKGEVLPGGQWLRLTPRQPLEFGEYALIEVLDERTVNLNVWDFGVHSAARENMEAIRPETPRSSGLERR